MRTLLGVTATRGPRRAWSPGEIHPIVAQLPEPVPEVRRVAPEVVEWKEGQLARVEERRIAIREPIQFEFGTARILPESLPVLDAVVQVLADYWQIEHLVIVGHASEEGSFAYNDELSVARARAVHRALVEAGIHPDRLSYQGMGEVAPKSLSTVEAELARDRRVEFRIVHLLTPVEAAPARPAEFRLPWTGVVIPARPVGTRILGQEETGPEPAPPEAPVDLLKQYLKEEREAPEPGSPPPPESTP
jgi:outer membrane protein OmpA-like peptidoglycan-associated protein